MHKQTFYEILNNFGADVGVTIHLSSKDKIMCRVSDIEVHDNSNYFEISRVSESDDSLNFQTTCLRTWFVEYEDVAVLSFTSR